MTPSDRPCVGVVALQGAVAEHRKVLTALGAATRRVTRPEHLDGLAAVVLPGGESSAMVRLAAGSGLFPALAERTAAGLPVFGTCAGLVLLARDVEDAAALSGFARVPALDVTVRRNAYGAQRESFVAPLAVRGLAGDGGAGTVEAVFIRAPQITGTDPGVEVLAEHDGVPVLVRQGHVMAASFHPELTPDPRIHALFLSAAGVLPATASEAAPVRTRTS